MNEINQLGRLRIVNHGTQQKPRYVAVGVFSALPCGVLLPGERDAALFDVCTVLGQESIRHVGTPADPAFGLAIDDVIRAFPNTLVTAAELENLTRIQKAMGGES